jgi:hypothetical protein
MMRGMPDAESIPIHDLPHDAEPDAAPSGHGPGAAERAVDLLAGIVSFGASMVVAALDGEDDDDRSAGLASVVAAGAGLLLEGLRAAGPVLSSVERTAGPAVASSGAAQSVGELMEHWRSTWDERREDDDQRAADDELRRAFQRTVDTVLDQLDLTTLVVDHLDVQRVASTLDINAMVADLDVDALAARIDMDRLTDRIDIDALVARLDVEALIARLDVPGIAAQVIDELDLLQMIRSVSADTASEGVRDVRLRGVEADRMIRRVIDRLLSRSDGAKR